MKITMKDPFGCLQGVEISPEIVDLQSAELGFWGSSESIENKLEKLASWGLSEERIVEKKS